MIYLWNISINKIYWSKILIVMIGMIIGLAITIPAQGNENIHLPESSLVPENIPPFVSFSPVFYIVRENTGSGILSITRSGQSPGMLDIDQETIS